jgi:serine/threonine protein kinase
MSVKEKEAGSAKEEEDDEFQTENAQAKKLAEFISKKVQIGKYKIKKIIGAGANGLVALVNHADTDDPAVMKVAMNLSTSGSLYWESDIMDRLVKLSDGEDRTRHIVRKLDAGHTQNYENQDVGYIVMENLPGNPVGVLGYLSGRKLLEKVCEFGVQLLKAIYDMHYLGLVHRDLKPENVGLYKKKMLVLYDLGMARFFTDSIGNQREPRCNVGMRGTDEWASLYAEHGRDQGRVDDLFGWFYVMIEWANCSSKYPLAWAPYDTCPRVRQLMKTSLFPARHVLHNCPEEFYRIHSYLRGLGRNDTPNYLYLADVLKECMARLKEEQKFEDENKVKPLKRRTRYSQFFEVEQILDEQEAHHEDTTIAAKLDLARAGVEDARVSRIPGQQLPGQQSPMKAAAKKARRL